MKRIAALVFLLLASCNKDKGAAPAAVAEPGTRFTKVAPAVGQTREETSDITMTLKGASTVERSKRIEKVLAVTGDTVTKMQVKFESAEPNAAVVGKTYVVDANAITDEAGKAAAPGEAKDVRKIYRAIGKPDPIAASLPTAALHPGEKVDALAKAIGEQMKDDGEGITAEGVVVTFKEARGDIGVFDVSLKLAKNEPPVTMTIDAKGEAWVSTKDGQTTKLDLKGPITIHGGPLEGTGEMTMKLEGHRL